jgi:hypothetical protein
MGLFYVGCKAENRRADDRRTRGQTQPARETLARSSRFFISL